MPQQIGWSVEAKLLYEIKQLTRQLSGRQYILTFPTFASFPTPGITGTLYVDEATGDIYVWNGTAYTILSSGITALNGLIAAAQLLTTGSTGTDFNISSVGTTHTFNIPTASATNRGLLSSANWTTFNNKQNAITLTTTGTSGAATLVGSTLNIPQYQSVLTNPVTGTGTTNYVAKFTAGSTIGNSQIFDNGTNVGIGTTSPTAKLTVVGAGAQTILNSGTTADARMEFHYNSGREGFISWDTDNLRLQADAGNYLTFFSNATERLRITSGGDVGIGTDAPNARITVQAGASVASAMTFRANNVTSTSELFVGQSIGNDAFFYNRANAIISLGTNNTERMRIFANGRVGINTTTDAGYQLDVNGTFRTSGSAISQIVLNTTNASGAVINHQQSGSSIGWIGNGSSAVIGGSTSDYGINSQGSLFLATGAYRQATITLAGDMGIGTTSPSYKLDINGTLRSVNGANFATTSGNVGVNTASPVMPFQLNNFGGFDGNGNQLIIRNNVYYNNTNARSEPIQNGYQTQIEMENLDGKIRFSTSSASNNVGTAASLVERMRITNNGEVWINTTTDAGDYKLQVSGNQYLSGKLVVGTTTDSGQTVQINSSLRLIPTSTVPTASAGTLYYDTATNKLKLYNGTSWVDLN